MAKTKPKSLSEKLKGVVIKKTTSIKTEPKILLCDNIPAPLHGIAPRVVLGGRWWDIERRKAYQATDYHCLACGIAKEDVPGRKILDGHEIYKINYRKGTMTYVRAVSLCKRCHNFIHDGMLLALLERGDITHASYSAVIQHGTRVLAEAGLRRPSREEREELALSHNPPDWYKWRLVIGKEKYPPRFTTQEEWEEYLEQMVK